MFIRKVQHDIEPHENLDIVITTPELNILLKIEDYHKLMYPNASDAGYIAIATKDKENKWSQRMYKANEWYKYIEEENNCYISMNSFYRPTRQTRAVRHLNSFFIDIDYYNEAVSKEDVFQAIEFYVKTQRLLAPTFVIDSGKGLYLIFKIEDVPGVYKQTKGLYNVIQDYLCELFKDFGADVNSKDISRVLRIPGTTNLKNNKKVEIIHYNENAFYTMSMFTEFLDDYEEIKERNETWRKAKTNNKEKLAFTKNTKRVHKLTYLFNEYTLNKSRSLDIEKILEMRNYTVPNMRDIFLYIYHYYMLLIHKDEKVALYHTLNINDKLHEPLEKKEVTSYIKSSIKAYYEHLKDKRKGYNFRNETLIKLLKITKEEQQHLKTIIGKREKYDRKNKKRSPRNEEGLTSREAKKQKLIKEVKRLHAEGFKQKEIAEKLGIHKSNVSRYIKL